MVYCGIFIVEVLLRCSVSALIALFLEKELTAAVSRTGEIMKITIEVLTVNSKKADQYNPKFYPVNTDSGLAVLAVRLPMAQVLKLA